MSTRELCFKLLESVPDYKIDYVVGYLQGIIADDQNQNDDMISWLLEAEEEAKHTDKRYTTADIIDAVSEALGGIQDV